MLIKDLNVSDRELLENILRKDAVSLTTQEKEILAARRDYVSQEDYQRLMGESSKPAKNTKKPNKTTSDPFADQKTADKKEKKE